MAETLASRQLVGVMGGTFDPVHYGHLRVAQAAKQVLRANEMRLLPCHVPPHRNAPSVSDADRLNMLRLALKEKEFSDLQLDMREYSRQGPSYSVDTLAELREELGSDSAIVWLMGADAFNQLDTWERWEKLSDFAHIAVAVRPGATLSPSSKVSLWLDNHLVSSERIAESPSGAVTLLEIPPIAMSATEVREQLRSNASIDQFVPAEVARYIREKKLYL